MSFRMRAAVEKLGLMVVSVGEGAQTRVNKRVSEEFRAGV